MTPESVIMGAAFIVTLAFLIFSEAQQWKRYKAMTERHDAITQKLLDRIMAGDYRTMKQTDAFANNVDVAAKVLREEEEADDPSDIGQ